MSCPCLFHLSFPTWLLRSPFPCLLRFLLTQTFGLFAQPVPVLLFLLHPLLADSWFSQFPPRSPIPKAYTPPRSIFVQPSQIIPCSDGLHPNLASITLKHKLLTPAVGFPLVSKLVYTILPSTPQASSRLILLTWPYLPSLHSASLSLSVPFLRTELAPLSPMLETVWVVFESTEETGCGVIRASSTWPRTHRS